MTVLIKTHERHTIKPKLTAFCEYCCKRNHRKNMTKARDGPIDHFYCNASCAAEWGAMRNSKLGNLFIQTPKDRMELVDKLSPKKRAKISHLLLGWQESKLQQASYLDTQLF